MISSRTVKFVTCGGKIFNKLYIQHSYSALVGVQNIVCLSVCVSVCLYVCLSASISLEPLY